MRLADLLADTSTEDLERLAYEHARADERLSRPELLETIEGVLRSYRFHVDFLVNRQPPCFAIITLLLDQPKFDLPTTGFREAVLAETQRICDAIDSGEILRRDDQLRVYRRALYQARSNDLKIDASEAAILGVLRQELYIAHVEHFLIEHHVDLREFWQQDGAFADELHALRSAGLVFVHEGRTLVPEDLVPVIRHVLGIDMSRDATRRLLGYLTGHDLHDALATVGAPTSGSKDQRIERLMAHMVQPRSVLQHVALDVLREICREIGATVAGSKDDLVRRVISHMGAGRDRVEVPEPAPPTVKEARRLNEPRFGHLFERLRGHELAAILGEFNLRRWGTKEQQIRTLWQSDSAESSMLLCLSNAELEAVLRRSDIKSAGSKTDRVERLIEHFAGLAEGELPASHTPPAAGAEGLGPGVTME
jgi:hypothetical protein